MNRCEIEVGEYVGIAVDKVWNENIYFSAIVELTDANDFL